MTGSGFWWILLASGLYGAIHSLLASESVKALAARKLGMEAYRRYYRLFFSVMALASALPLPALVWLLPDRVIYVIRPPWLYLTALAQLIAGAAIVLVIMQTGAMRFLGFQQLLEKTREHAPEQLVLGGFYRWVRHPLYTASFVLLWLMPVMSWNLLALNLGLSGYMLVGSIFEEQKLVNQFGTEYEEYRRQTPRLLPGLRRGQKKIPLDEKSPRG